MNRFTPVISVLAVAGMAWGGSDNPGESDGERIVFTDAASDAALRRTDPSYGAALPLIVPDLLELTVGGWCTPTPSTDPYDGEWVSGADADLLRVDLVIAGLVNPPGTLSPFNPAKYGPRPLIAFIELDADNEKNTGGECELSAVRTRYLANVARFGALPFGSYGERAARNQADLDAAFNEPEVELTGAEFVLALCGCTNTTVVSTCGDSSPTTFDAGDSWIVRGRFFQRAGGYSGPSAFFGGSAPGEFDPYVNLLYRHHPVQNRTTISLVFPLTMAGAADLSGQPEQAPDTSVANHTSVYEALLDIVDSVDYAWPGCEDELIRRWDDDDICEAMNPSRWNARAVVGVPYLQQQAFPYAYTDVGFQETVADLDSDGSITPLDRSAFDSWLISSDGSPTDADGVADGVFTIASFGPNFQVHDFTGDGVVDEDDRVLLEPAALCSGDTNGDNVVNFADLNIVLSTFGQSGANLPGDVTADGVVNFADLNTVLSNFGESCL
ncbi:MAG: hypothetical protein ACTS27_05660 [Phycisphaerales bacterium]